MVELMLVLFCSPKNSDHAAAGLRLVRGVSREKKVGVLLMQDAVLMGLKGPESAVSTFGEIAEGYALEEHLAKRGFGPESLVPPFKALSYDGAVELLMGDALSVIGCF